MDELHKSERLFRKIPDNPIMFKENGEISSAVFKDSLGCSVDRQGTRSLAEVYQSFADRFGESEKGIVAVADVSVQDCCDKNAVVKELPENDNPYHCEIHGSNEKEQLSQGQARYLAKVANVYRFSSENLDT